MIINILIGLGVALFGFVLQTSVAGINRKVIARLQKREGPKWYQEFIDIFKLLSKRSVSHGWIFDFGVIMAVGGIIATAAFMPLTSTFSAFGTYDNFFIFVYLLAVGMLGMAMSASGSGNPWASIGVMRALTTMLAYEVPFMIVVLTIVKLAGSSSLTAIQLYQQAAGNHWFLIALPLGGIVGFLALMGMLGKKPFETYIAPGEIGDGRAYRMECQGRRIEQPLQLRAKLRQALIADRGHHAIGCVGARPVIDSHRPPVGRKGHSRGAADAA